MDCPDGTMPETKEILAKLAELPCIRCTFTQEFHDHVISVLAKLETGQVSIIDRLDKQNGNVALLFKRTNEHESRIAVIDSSGSRALQHLNERLQDLQEARVGQEASRNTIRAILKDLMPVFWMIAVVFGVLVLTHPDTVLGALGLKR